ncbi:MAG: hypothetical protein WAM13_11615 [Candidatus Sulfotelmatobacter sp.]|jgi:hypothetical protein
MHKLTLPILLLLSTISLASDPKPADHTITVHVSATRIAFGGHLVQDLDVLIDGKKYELASELSLGQLLALGDYKAKLVKDEHRSTYDSYQVYEFLFPDGKTRKFDVVGQIE